MFRRQCMMGLHWLLAYCSYICNGEWKHFSGCSAYYTVCSSVLCQAVDVVQPGQSARGRQSCHSGMRQGGSPPQVRRSLGRRCEHSRCSSQCRCRRGRAEATPREAPWPSSQAPCRHRCDAHRACSLCRERPVRSIVCMLPSLSYVRSNSLEECEEAQ